MTAEAGGVLKRLLKMKISGDAGGKPMSSSHMYKENRKSINWFVGCAHNCVYCKPSFQRQMKRQRKRCEKCYYYEPHAHLKRLLKTPPKTIGNEFIFFPSSGDPAFASPSEFQTAIDYTRKYRDRTFLIQTKNPECLLNYNFPSNVILGTTIETDITVFGTPSKYRIYEQISNAPFPMRRFLIMKQLCHKRKLVTIEPILDFGRFLALFIREISPGIVYVGYDNHNCKLPEPKLAKTQLLIKELKKFTEVRVKTLRKAWWEV